jgi:hypothetical protein
MQNCKFDIYDDGSNPNVRFLLGQKGHRKVYVIGLNPSTADAKQSDQTISKVKCFIEARKKFDDFVMLNLCPSRSTNPNALPKFESEEMLRLAEYNYQAIHGLLEEENSPTIWAAWGDSIKKYPYLFKYLRKIEKATANRKSVWEMCGEFTKLGHPRHPSRIGYQSRFRNFDVEKYLCAFAPLR